MTGRQFVSLMARMSGIPSSNEAANEAISVVKMTERADTRIAGYSKGMRQRIKLAQAIAHKPKVLILDEPLNGLDPVGRREMQELLTGLGRQGISIVISSHILHEVEQMTHSIVLLHRGRLLAVGDVRDIRGLIDKHPHRIRIEMDGARQFGQTVLGLDSVLSISFDRNHRDKMEVETAAPDEFYSQIANLVMERNVELRRMMSPDNNLEAVFGYLVKG
jgi:ABC-2 type transport system ATP-binding protein